MMCRFKTTELSAIIAVLGFHLVGGLGLAHSQETLPEPSVPTTEQAPVETKVETILRGPLHEAFAEPVEFDPKPGLIVKNRPPEPIDEIPPEMQPADKNAIWISGYWAWDDEREDFLWVSGVWRVPPPDRRWVPGYWTEAEGGFQWVPGFWAAIDADQIGYLPVPPESLEQGPSSEQPSVNHYWVSGCWVYRDGSYVWRPGYWEIHHEGWAWIPAHYSWTPRGAIFVDGYWDYPLVRRGVLFAPVYFHDPAYSNHGHYYSPSVSVNLGHLLLHLFVRPNHQHYYWGDWYGGEYQRRGFYATYDYHGHRGYDPVYVHHETHYKQQGIDYSHQLRSWHNHIAGQADWRPPRTMEAQTRFAVRANKDSRLKHSVLGQTTEEIMADTGGKSRFRKLNKNARMAQARTAVEIRGLAEHRNEIEAFSPVHGDPRNSAQRSSSSKATVKVRKPGEAMKLPKMPKVDAPRMTPTPPTSHRPNPGSVQPRREGPPVRERLRPDQPGGNSLHPKLTKDHLPNPKIIPHDVPKPKVELPKQPKDKNHFQEQKPTTPRGGKKGGKGKGK